MNNLIWMRNQLSAHDPNWSVSYTPWGDKIICHITMNGVTRSHSANTADGAFERAYLMFWDIGENINLMWRPVDGKLADYLMRAWGHMLPKDADFIYVMPTEQDDRFWIDVVSFEYAKEDENDDPVVEQLVLVPASLVQHLLPSSKAEDVNSNFSESELL